ncbi:hypothetical protein IE81DRAFT_314616 [Ceraceosorus guamensis]|uniref:MFS general substrate transporter n=1 Tax=Ceraceosorus guamensis TaxID=1522189 RepID=A0A316VW20_9BASI|nr:hypothetical protein IE81DRAFT_314616 [Ceraceosorus guamensis]PWN41806.1 hypothetical protein IE81DRAFT_314616 [Ceraceosorus guamensis]
MTSRQRPSAEEEPLLGQGEAGTLSPPTEGLWPLIVVLVTSALWSLADFAPKAAAIDALRKFSCAEFYSVHPHPSPADLQAWMTQSSGAAQTARYVLITDTMNSLLTLLAILYFGPKLSKWGRKPVLLISLCAILVMQMGFLVLPIAYPYGPDVDQVGIHPVLTMYLIIGGYVISGLLGAVMLPLVTFRTLVADRSTAAKQTRNLTWLTLTYLGGVMFGPLLAGLLAELFPITSNGIDAALESEWWYWMKSEAPEQPPVPTPQPVPPLPPGRADERNVTPFVVSLSFAILALLFAAFFVAESNPTQASAPSEAEEQDVGASQSTAPRRTSLASKLGPLRLLVPPKVDGKRDWRYSRLALVQSAGTSGGTGLTVLIVGTGHIWAWDPSSVGFMLSWIGGSRAVVLFAVVPLLVKLTEKIVPKPMQLVGLSDAELERLAKGARAEDIGDADDEEDVADRRAATSSTDRLEDRDSDARLKPLVVLWRCAVDLSLARISFFTEMLGYMIISTAALLRNSPLMLFGTVFLSLGGGYAPAMQSACIALASDVFSGVAVEDEAGAPNAHKPLVPKKLGSADAALSAFSIIDTLVQTCVPVATTSLYAATNETFPPAPFILITAFYAIAVTALSGLSPHRSHHH